MPTALSRRQFLRGAAGAGIVVAGGAAVANLSTIENLFRKRDTEGPLAPSDGVLVLVTLAGGNDGLNTLVPVGASASAYASGRGELAIAASDALVLGDGLGLHPQLKGLKALWDKGALAVVRGVGYPEPNRSHFRSMDIWQTGVPVSAVATGWLGRWLDATGADPLRAVSVGATETVALRGERTAGATVPVGPLQLPGGAGLRDAVAGFGRGSGDDLLGRAAASYGDLLRVQDAVSAALAHTDDDPDAAPDGSLENDGGGDLGPQLDLVATLVKARVPCRVYAVTLGGFDTHANEKDVHARLLGQFDTAVTSFLGKMGTAPVTVLGYSEFGRRVAANAGGGTDHGTAAPVFVAGPRVKGGFVGDEPSLTDLDDGDLKATTDFRSVYASVLGHTLGTEATAAILPGPYPAALPLFT